MAFTGTPGRRDDHARISDGCPRRFGRLTGRGADFDTKTANTTLLKRIATAEDIALMNDLLAGGTLQGPVPCSFVMGVRYGYQPAPETVLYARGLLPPDAEFTAGRHRQGVLHDRGAVLSCRRSRSDRSRGCGLSVPR